MSLIMLNYNSFNSNHRNPIFQSILESIGTKLVPFNKKAHAGNDISLDFSFKNGGRYRTRTYDHLRVKQVL
jgi:hypothetical protein